MILGEIYDTVCKRMRHVLNVCIFFAVAKPSKMWSCKSTSRGFLMWTRHETFGEKTIKNSTSRDIPCDHSGAV